MRTLRVLVIHLVVFVAIHFLCTKFNVEWRNVVAMVIIITTSLVTPLLIKIEAKGVVE
jgi:hypothetical protein